MVFGLAMSVAPIVGVTCGSIMVVFSVIAIIGGICAILKRLFAMAIVGAVFAMLNLFTFGAGFIMGLIALILIAIGKDSFVPIGGYAPQPPIYYPPPPY